MPCSLSSMKLCFFSLYHDLLLLSFFLVNFSLCSSLPSAFCSLHETALNQPVHTVPSTCTHIHTQPQLAGGLDPPP